MADSIALGFICKNEAHVIERMIRSCAPYVTEVFALDTGSTDNTVDVITSVCASLNLPATVAQVEWTNFGEMRSLMMSEARKNSSAEWLLQMDADWELIVDGEDNPFENIGTAPNCDVYGLTIHDSGQEWPLPMLTRMQHPWYYSGAVHEFLASEGKPGINRPGLAGVKAIHHNDGGNRAGRHHRDVEVLRGKNDTRSLFYFAQSLRAIEQHQEALDAYLVRAERTDGWEEETYWSLYMAARCAVNLGETDRALGLALRSWDFRPTRLEGLCTALEILRSQKNWTLCYLMAGTAMSIAKKGDGLQDSLFVEKWRWEYGARFEYLAAMSVLGNKTLALAGWEDMLSTEDYTMTDDYTRAVTWNIGWLRQQMGLSETVEVGTEA